MSSQTSNDINIISIKLKKKKKKSHLIILGSRLQHVCKYMDSAHQRDQDILTENLSLFVAMSNSISLFLLSKRFLEFEIFHTQKKKM